MKNSIIKIVTNIIFLVTLLVIVFLLYFTYQSKKDPDKVPTIFGITPLTVLTNSMNPNIEAGDIVIIKRVNPSEIKIDDVITFKEIPTKIVTHRVVDIKNDNGKIGFVTKGDNNNVIDTIIVTSDHLIGSLLIKIPKAGFFAKFVTGPIGFILLILIPAAGYICLEVFERLSKQKKEGAV